MTFTYRAFGWNFESSVPWAGCPTASSQAKAQLHVRRSTTDDVHSLWSGAARTVWRTTFDDGRSCRFSEGEDGDRMLEYGSAQLHIDATASWLTFHQGSESDAVWQRFFLDTGLLLVALTRGRRLLHAGAVMIGVGTVALLGQSGAGKSTTLAELVLRGHALVCDDVLPLEPTEDGSWLAHPTPPVMNLSNEWRPGASAIGEVLHDFGEETWVAVSPAQVGPTAFSLAVVLSRQGTREEIRRLGGSVIDVLPYVLGLDRSPATDRDVFESVGNLASVVPIVQVIGTPDSPPSRLAEMVEEAESSCALQSATSA